MFGVHLDAGCRLTRLAAEVRPVVVGLTSCNSAFAWSASAAPAHASGAEAGVGGDLGEVAAVGLHLEECALEVAALVAGLHPKHDPLPVGRVGVSERPQAASG